MMNIEFCSGVNPMVITRCKVNDAMEKLVSRLHRKWQLLDTEASKNRNYETDRKQEPGPHGITSCWSASSSESSSSACIPPLATSAPCPVTVGATLSACSASSAASAKISASDGAYAIVSCRTPSVDATGGALELCPACALGAEPAAR